MATAYELSKKAEQEHDHIQTAITETDDHEEPTRVVRFQTMKPLEIYEVHTPDGGVGLKFGDGPIHMGYDGGDLMNLLAHIFPGECGEIDGDLYDLAHTYLGA